MISKIPSGSSQLVLFTFFTFRRETPIIVSIMEQKKIPRLFLLCKAFLTHTFAKLIYLIEPSLNYS